jgi:tetratricopeptide (TPR) repeat protein
VALSIAAVAGGSVAIFAGGRTGGQPLTGSVPGSSSDRVAEALSLETQGKAVDALKVYDDILGQDPGNVEALTYRGWLLKRAGLPDQALESLDRAVAADPTFPDAHFFRGMVLYQDKDDPAGAVVEFQAFLADNPPADYVAQVQQVLAQAEAAAAAKAAGAPAPAADPATPPAADPATPPAADPAPPPA